MPNPVPESRLEKMQAIQREKAYLILARKVKLRNKANMGRGKWRPCRAVKLSVFWEQITCGLKILYSQVQEVWFYT